MKNMKKQTVIDMTIVRSPLIGIMEKKEMKHEIRCLADNDEGYENIVFELGLSVLVKEIMKGRKGSE